MNQSFNRNVRLVVGEKGKVLLEENLIRISRTFRVYTPISYAYTFSPLLSSLLDYTNHTGYYFTLTRERTRIVERLIEPCS